MKCKYCGRKMEFDCTDGQATCYSCLCGAEYYTSENGVNEWSIPDEIDIKKVSPNYTLTLEDTFNVKDANAISQGRLSFVDEYGNTYEIIKHLAPRYDVHFRYNTTPDVAEIGHYLNTKEVIEYLQRKDIKISQIIRKDGEIND